jgi:hypothetical protein
MNQQPLLAQFGCPPHTVLEGVYNALAKFPDDSALRPCTLVLTSHAQLEPCFHFVSKRLTFALPVKRAIVRVLPSQGLVITCDKALGAGVSFDRVEVECATPAACEWIFAHLYRLGCTEETYFDATLALVRASEEVLSPLDESVRLYKQLEQALSSIWPDTLQGLAKAICELLSKLNSLMGMLTKGLVVYHEQFQALAEFYPHQLPLTKDEARRLTASLEGCEWIRKVVLKELVFMGNKAVGSKASLKPDLVLHLLVSALERLLGQDEVLRGLDKLCASGAGSQLLTELLRTEPRALRPEFVAFMANIQGKDPFELSSILIQHVQIVGKLHLVWANINAHARSVLQNNPQLAAKCDALHAQLLGLADRINANTATGDFEALHAGLGCPDNLLVPGRGYLYSKTLKSTKQKADQGIHVLSDMVLITSRDAIIAVLPFFPVAASRRGVFPLLSVGLTQAESRQGIYLNGQQPNKVEPVVFTWEGTAAEVAALQHQVVQAQVGFAKRAPPMLLAAAGDGPAAMIPIPDVGQRSGGFLRGMSPSFASRPASPGLRAMPAAPQSASKRPASPSLAGVVNAIKGGMRARSAVLVPAAPPLQTPTKAALAGADRDQRRLDQLSTATPTPSKPAPPTAAAAAAAVNIRHFSSSGSSTENFPGNILDQLKALGSSESRSRPPSVQEAPRPAAVAVVGGNNNNALPLLVGHSRRASAPE